MVKPENILGSAAYKQKMGRIRVRHNDIKFLLESKSINEMLERCGVFPEENYIRIKYLIKALEEMQIPTPPLNDLTKDKQQDIQIPDELSTSIIKSLRNWRKNNHKKDI